MDYSRYVSQKSLFDQLKNNIHRVWTMTPLTGMTGWTATMTERSKTDGLMTMIHPDARMIPFILINR